MVRKPTKEYLQLQKVLKENAIREQNEKDAKALHDNMKKETNLQVNKDIQSSIQKSKESDKVKTEYAQYRSQVKSDILESVISTLVKESVPDTIDVDKYNNFIDAIVREFVEKEDVYKLLENMNKKSLFLAELAGFVNEAADKEVEDVDDEDPDTFIGNAEPATDLVDAIKGDEDVANITDIIKDRVSRATDEFIQKNVIDQQDIKDVLADVKERTAAVKTGDEATDEEVKEQFEDRAQREIAQIKRRPGGIFEQLVRNLTEAVMKDDNLREQYTVSGMVNMEAIIDKATCSYTLLEVANSIKLKEFTGDEIKEYITIS